MTGENIEKNMGLVYLVANKYKNQGLERKDCIQEGVFGLLKAEKDYDSSKGSFSNYALYWIRSYINKAIIYKSRVIRLPESAIIQKKLIRKAIEKVGTSPKAIAKETKINIERIKTLLNYNENIDSLDRTANNNEEQDLTVHDVIAGPVNLADELDQKLKEEALRNALDEAFSCLPFREANILKLLTGFDCKQMKETELAEDFGVSRQTINTAKLKALKSMKKYIDVSTISKYLTN